MPDVIGSAVVEVHADAGKLDKDITSQLHNTATRAGAGMESSFAQTFRRIAASAVATFAVIKVGQFIGEGIASLGNLQKIAAQSEAVIKSTGGAANVTAKQIDDLGQSIETATGIEKESIEAGSNLLLTFTNITNGVGAGNDVFNQATNLLADMSTALGTDAAGSAIQLGKALNDPIKGITALTRVGVSFTEGQKKQIAALVEAGDVMGAQKIILAELNREFGGSAKAFGETLPGAIAKFKNAIGDSQEAIASGFIPALTGIVPVATQAFRELEPIFGAVGKAIGRGLEALKPVLITIVDNIHLIKNAIVDLNTGEFKFDNIKDSLHAALGAIGIADSNLNFDSIASTIVNGIATAVAALPTETISKAIITVVTSSVGAVAAQMPMIVGTLLPVIVRALPAISIGFAEGLVRAFADNPIPLTAFAVALALLPEAIVGGLATVLEGIPLIGLVAPFILDVLEGIGSLIVGALGAIVGPAFIEGIGIAATFIGEAFLGVGAAIVSAVLGLPALVIGAIIAAVAAIIGIFVFNLFGLRDKIFDFFTNTLPTAFTTGINAIVGFFAGLPAAIASGLATFLTTINTWIGQAIGFIVEGIGFLLGRWVKFWIVDIPNAVQSAISAVLAFVTQWLPQMVQKALDLGSRFLAAVVSFFSQLPGRVSSFLSSTATAVANKIPELVEKARDLGRRFIDGAVEWFKKLPGKLADAISSAIAGVGSFFSSMYNKAVELAKRFVSGFLKGLTNSPEFAAVVYFERMRGQLNDQMDLIGRDIKAFSGTMANAFKPASVVVPALSSGVSLPGGASVASSVSSSLSRRAPGAGAIGSAGTLTRSDLREFVAMMLAQLRPITVNEVAGDPVATAQAVAARLGDLVTR